MSYFGSEYSDEELSAGNASRATAQTTTTTTTATGTRSATATSMAAFTFTATAAEPLSDELSTSPSSWPASWAIESTSPQPVTGSSFADEEHLFRSAPAGPAAGIAVLQPLDLADVSSPDDMMQAMPSTWGSKHMPMTTGSTSAAMAAAGTVDVHLAAATTLKPKPHKKPAVTAAAAAATAPRTVASRQLGEVLGQQLAASACPEYIYDFHCHNHTQFDSDFAPHVILNAAAEALQPYAECKLAKKRSGKYIHRLNVRVRYCAAPLHCRIGVYRRSSIDSYAVVFTMVQGDRSEFQELFDKVYASKLRHFDSATYNRSASAATSTSTTNMASTTAASGTWAAPAAATAAAAVAASTGPVLARQALSSSVAAGGGSVTGDSTQEEEDTGMLAWDCAPDGSDMCLTPNTLMMGLASLRATGSTTGVTPTPRHGAATPAAATPAAAATTTSTSASTSTSTSTTSASTSTAQMSATAAAAASVWWRNQPSESELLQLVLQLAADAQAEVRRRLDAAHWIAKLARSRPGLDLVLAAPMDVPQTLCSLLVPTSPSAAKTPHQMLQPLLAALYWMLRDPDICRRTTATSSSVAAALSKLSLPHRGKTDVQELVQAVSQQLAVAT